MENKNCTKIPDGQVFDEEKNKFAPLVSNLEANPNWVAESPTEEQ